MIRTMLPLLTALSLLCGAAQALFFYIDGKNPKCFYEELPKDTLVVGHFDAAEYDDHSKSWSSHDGLQIYISVDEVFDNNHRVVNQRGGSKGRFTFTAHEAGDHKICFTPSSSSGRSGWMDMFAPNGGVKLNLDMAIGEGSQIESSDKTKMDDLSQRIKDINTRLQDVRREQVFQREREAEFRDQSESTNSRVVRWMLIQLVVLAATCAWQLSHLRNFFIKQKLT